jgi:ABC-type polysaccharide/polyol phosphate export permease
MHRTSNSVHLLLPFAAAALPAAAIRSFNVIFSHYYRDVENFWMYANVRQ